MLYEVITPIIQLSHVMIGGNNMDQQLPWETPLIAFILSTISIVMSGALFKRRRKVA